MLRRLYFAYLQLNYPDLRVTEHAALSVRLAGIRLLARLLLLSYALLLLRPALPVVRDVLAHTCYKAYHLRVVHRVNGQQHVHDELIRVSGDGQKQKHTGKWSPDTSEPAMVGPVLTLPSVVPAPDGPRYRDHVPVMPVTYPDPDDLPPRAGKNG